MKAILSCLILALSLLSSQAGIEEQARSVHTAKESSIFGIRGIIKMSATMNGKPAGDRETEIWNNGLLVGEGLVMTAYRGISPDFSAQERPGLEIESEIAELKLVDASGEEFPAKLILHDEDLGVAFIALDPSSELAAEFKGSPVSLEGDPKVQLLEELVGIGRFNSTLRYSTSLRTAPVNSIVKRPRLKYIVGGFPVGQSIFNANGDLVGLIVPHSEKGKPGAVPVILPNQYIRQVLPQAKEKQAELAE